MYWAHVPLSNREDSAFQSELVSVGFNSRASSVVKGPKILTHLLIIVMGEGGNHKREDQKKRKKVFTIRFRIFDLGGWGRNLVGDQFRSGGEPKRQLRSEDRKKNKRRSPRTEELYFSQKLVEDQK